jgi:cytochrome c oxidase cbb3-type subunit 3
LRKGMKDRAWFRAAGLAALAAALFLLLPTTLQGQAKKNPLAGNPRAIHEGNSLFRMYCSLCHGLDAHGGSRGPDLTRGSWTHGGTDADLFRTITGGVPGTLMPANDLSPTETWEVIAWLRSLAPNTPPGSIGNPKAGKELFFGDANCSLCHMVDGQGGRLGPDLSRVGSKRSSAYLLKKIRNPNIDVAAEMMPPGKEWPIEYSTVTVVQKDGQSVVGILRNEDAFSIQLMDLGENLHFFLKKDLKKVVHERRTLMPIFDTDTLSDRQLHDVVAYLETLRGRSTEAAKK